MFSSRYFSFSFRTWEASGQLLAVTSHHGRDQLVLHLAGGHLCVQLALHPRPKATLCLSRTHLSDGRWHSVTASRLVLRSTENCLVVILVPDHRKEWCFLSAKCPLMPTLNAG